MDNSNEMKEDFLKELANIGLGHASTALSQMINSRVDISLPAIGVIPVQRVLDVNDGFFCVTTMGIAGDAKGSLVNLFSDKTSFWIIDKISGNDTGTTKEFSDESKTVMNEFANIIGGAFLTSLSNFSNMNLLPKLPDTYFESASQVKNDFNSIIEREVQNALYVRTEISVDDVKIQGEIYLVLDNESFDAMFKKFN